MGRRDWDFDYHPLPRYSESTAALCHVVATRNRVAPEVISDALRRAGLPGSVEVLLDCAPLFWCLVELSVPVEAERLEKALAAASLHPRYVTPSVRGCLRLGTIADWTTLGREPTPSEWRVHPERQHDDERTAGHWFLGPDGVHVDRLVCGTGAGTRLAVIDDAGRDADALELDAEIPVAVAAVPRSSSHGCDLIAWAKGTLGRPSEDLAPFTGVAPDTSARLYCIPKPGKEVYSLALAIVRAVRDGADVIACATYVEGTMSPMLDDAFEYAVRVGRHGRGTALLFASGREVSSPPDSVHASLSLALADPACDPRALCIAPSGRDGGWFLWTDRLGRRRPFSNRGPSVSVSAPGDDMARPLLPEHRTGHAESSGACAIAAGVASLVLGCNAEVSVSELYALLTETCEPSPPPSLDRAADPADLLPLGRDADGHDARCGYGRVSALRSCLCALDPVAAALVSMGEQDAAERYYLLPGSAAAPAAPYSREFARWSAVSVRDDFVCSQGLKSLLRHFRLIAAEPTRASSQDPGAALHAMVRLLRRLESLGPPQDLHDELVSVRTALMLCSQDRQRLRDCEHALAVAAQALWN